MQFDTKIAVVLRDDLVTWQKTNVTDDEANRAEVAKVTTKDLDLVGIAFRAERKTVDKIVDRLRFHP
jgi:hypothetical protein